MTVGAAVGVVGVELSAPDTGDARAPGSCATTDGTAVSNGAVTAATTEVGVAVAVAARGD